MSHKEVDDDFHALALVVDIGVQEDGVCLLIGLEKALNDYPHDTCCLFGLHCNVEDIIDDVPIDTTTHRCINLRPSEIIGARGGVIDVMEKPKLATQGADEVTMPTWSSWDAGAPGQSSHRSCC
jgi:hypothetical protein